MQVICMGFVLIRDGPLIFIYIKIKIKQQFTLGTGVDCTQVRSLNSEPAWINLGRNPKLIFGASSIGLISGAGDIDGLLDLKLRKQIMVIP